MGGAVAAGGHGGHFHLLGHHEHGIEADAETADDLGGIAGLGIVMLDYGFFAVLAFLHQFGVGRLLAFAFLEELLRAGAGDGAEIVYHLQLAQADAGGGTWYPGILGSSLESAKILYSCGPDSPDSVTQRVFVRQIQLDPWMQAFKAADAGWNGSLLVSQYEWLDSSSLNKLLVEYREPLNTEKCPVIIPEELDTFIDRANVSFSARFAGEGHVEASSITPYPWNSDNVSARLLSDVLGATDTAGGSR